MKLPICIALLIFLALPLWATEAGRDSKNNPLKNPKTPTASLPSEAAAEAVEIHYKFKLDADIGAASLTQGGAAFAVSTHFMFPVGLGPNLFAGPEAEFMLFSPGSVFSLLGGVSWDFRFRVGSPWSFALGGAGGVAFPYSLQNYANGATWEACGELSIIREIDDLSSLRATIRGGLLDGYLLIGIRFGVQFRFL